MVASNVRLKIFLRAIRVELRGQEDNLNLVDRKMLKGVFKWTPQRQLYGTLGILLGIFLTFKDLDHQMALIIQFHSLIFHSCGFNKKQTLTDAESHMQILKPSDFQTFTENLKLVPLNYGLNKSGLTLLLWNYSYFFIQGSF